MPCSGSTATCGPTNSTASARFWKTIRSFPSAPTSPSHRVVAHDHIVIRTWERGAGLTLACGSAACATLACAVRKGLADRKAVITVPGGDLTVEWAADGHLLMSGPAEFEFAGELDPATGQFTIETAAAPA